MPEKSSRVGLKTYCVVQVLLFSSGMTSPHRQLARDTASPPRKFLGQGQQPPDDAPPILQASHVPSFGTKEGLAGSHGLRRSQFFDVKVRAFAAAARVFEYMGEHTSYYAIRRCSAEIVRQGYLYFVPSRLEPFTLPCVGETAVCL